MHVIIMSVPLVCRSLGDDVSLNRLSLIYTCRHSTGSCRDGCFEMSLSRVSVDTVSSLGDVCHDAERPSRRSLVGREYSGGYHHPHSHQHHGSWDGVMERPGEGFVDAHKRVAYSNVAAILAMDGGNVQSYPWVTDLSSSAPCSCSGTTHGGNSPSAAGCSCTSTKTAHGREMMMKKSAASFAQHSIAMLQNALETVMNSESDTLLRTCHEGQ